MSATGTAARGGAAFLLDRVLGDGDALSDALSSEEIAALEPSERARAQRLATQALRGLDRIDRLLKRHLRRDPPLPVRNVLRVGTLEICTGAAPHGVVNACVSLVRASRRHRGMSGLVNAVLRKVADGGAEAWERLPVPRLPGWLRGRLTNTWGAATVAAIEKAHFSGAPLDLTPHPGRKADAAALGAEILPTGSLRLQAQGQVSALPGYETGDWWVQDAAAAVAVRVLDPQPGERIADLCAAPGGKTLQLAAAGARVDAVDASGERLKTLRENLARTELAASVHTADALTWQGQYDAILLDAPCSATGTMRRHPDLPWIKDGSGLAALFSLQAKLLDHAWSLLKPGGRLVFCTCSLLPEEGEAQVVAACARTADMAVDTRALNRPGLDPAWISAEGGLRLRPDFWPEQGGMDGFYIASLRKSATDATSGNVER